MRLILLSLTLIFAACTATIQPPRNIPIFEAQRYLLSLSDMPIGFTQTGSVTALNSNETVAQSFPDPVTMAANLEAWGREGGYIVVYDIGGLAAMLGTVHVEQSVVVYRNGDGARAYLDAWAEHEPQRFGGGEILRFVPVSAPPMGDYSVAYQTDFVLDESPHENLRNGTRYTVAFVRHNLLIFVETFSYGAGTFADALELAQKVERRLR